MDELLHLTATKPRKSNRNANQVASMKTTRKGSLTFENLRQSLLEKSAPQSTSNLQSSKPTSFVNSRLNEASLDNLAKKYTTCMQQDQVQTEKRILADKAKVQL